MLQWLSSDFQADKVDTMQIQLSHWVEEQDSVDMESQGPHKQLNTAEEMVRVCPNLKNHLLDF